MAHVYWNKLRLKAAQALGIDPDRISIRAGAEMYGYVVVVEGTISRADEHLLRSLFNGGSPAHITWHVKATVSG